MKKRAPGYQKERSERQRVRILNELEAGPMTAMELAGAAFLSRSRIHFLLKDLMKRPNRRVHISSFKFSEGRASYVYALGPHNNCTISKFRCDQIIASLQESSDAMSARQISWMLGLSISAVWGHIRTLRSKGLVHVVRWEWSDRTPMAMYVAGKGEDVDRPTVKPKKVAKSPVAPRGIFASLGL